MKSLPIAPGIKCFLFAWIPAWGAGLTLASVVIAMLELAPLTAGCGVACTFPVLDAIPPQAKLAFGALLGAAMLLARRRRPASFAVLAVRDAVSGAAAAALVGELLPGGFGVPLAAAPGLATPNFLYLFTAAAGGALGTMLERSCRARLIEG